MSTRARSDVGCSIRSGEQLWLPAQFVHRAMRHTVTEPAARHNVAVTEVVAQDGTHIHYEVEGAGPTILLLHGISADGQMNWEWTGIAPALRDAGFRTVAIDQRGHGKSDKPHDPERYHDDLFAGDVSEVLDDLGVEQCVLMGYSMGAYMALRTAPREHRVHALVLGGIGDNAPKDWDRENVARALETDELSEDHQGEARAIREYADATGADRLALAAIQRGRTEEHVRARRDHGPDARHRR